MGSFPPVFRGENYKYLNIWNHHIHSASIMLVSMRAPSTLIHVQTCDQLGNLQDAEGAYVVHVLL